MTVCAIVVTYNPTMEIEGNVRALLEQVDKVILVDNSACSSESLASISKTSRVQVILNGSNLGIGTALNIGVSAALQENFEWIATFDQDSRVKTGMIHIMIGAYESCPSKTEIGILSPQYEDIETGVITDHSHTRSRVPCDPHAVLVTMTSGNLVRSEIFRKVGLFSAALFIDYVDYEFCLRCAKLGYQVLEVPGARLLHRVGSPSSHELFGRHYLTTNHSPIRRYYAFRNRVWLYRHFHAYAPKLTRQLIAAGAREFLKILAFETERIAKTGAIAKGVWHGILNRLGPA